MTSDPRRTFFSGHGHGSSVWPLEALDILPVVTIRKTFVRMNVMSHVDAQPGGHDLRVVAVVQQQLPWSLLQSYCLEQSHLGNVLFSVAIAT